MKKFSLERLPNVKRHTFLFVLLQILLIIKKVKAKFHVGESNYNVCGYCKIIWILCPKCNTHIQVHFKIIHKWFR
jgi:hypothetical protein